MLWAVPAVAAVAGLCFTVACLQRGVPAARNEPIIAHCARAGRRLERQALDPGELLVLLNAESEFK